MSEVHTDVKHIEQERMKKRRSKINIALNEKTNVATDSKQKK